MNNIHSDLDRLLDMPSGATEILRWLLDGSMTLDGLIERRELALGELRPNRDPEQDFPHHDRAVHSVLFDLGELGSAMHLIAYSDGVFSLEGSYRSAVAVYDCIARQSRHHRAISDGRRVPECPGALLSAGETPLRAGTRYPHRTTKEKP